MKQVVWYGGFPWLCLDSDYFFKNRVCKTWISIFADLWGSPAAFLLGWLKLAGFHVVLLYCNQFFCHEAFLPSLYTQLQRQTVPSFFLYVGLEKLESRTSGSANLELLDGQQPWFLAIEGLIPRMVLGLSGAHPSHIYKLALRNFLAHHLWVSLNLPPLCILSLLCVLSHTTFRTEITLWAKHLPSSTPPLLPLPCGLPSYKLTLLLLSLTYLSLREVNYWRDQQHTISPRPIAAG